MCECSTCQEKALATDAEELATALGIQQAQILHFRDRVGSLTRLLSGQPLPRPQDRRNELQQQRDSTRAELSRVRQLRQANEGIGQLAGRIGYKSLTSAPTDPVEDLAEQEAMLNWELFRISGDLCREYGMCDLAN